MKTKNINKRVFDRIENVWKKYNEIYNDIHNEFGEQMRLLCNTRKDPRGEEWRVAKIANDFVEYFADFSKEIREAENEEYKVLYQEAFVAYHTFYGEYCETYFMKFLEDYHLDVDYEGCLAFVLAVAYKICAIDSCINFKK